jgi:Sensors of blue-light using FAD
MTPTRSQPGPASGSGLHHTIYVSRTTQPFSRDELQALSNNASGRNRLIGATGMLLYSGGTFLQVLEGRPRAIELLLERIRRDPRHDKLRVLRRAALQQRTFAAWHMGVLDVGDLPPLDADRFAMLLRILFARGPEHTDWAVRAVLRKFRSLLPAPDDPPAPRVTTGDMAPRGVIRR